MTTVGAVTGGRLAEIFWLAVGASTPGAGVEVEPGTVMLDMTASAR